MIFPFHRHFEELPFIPSSLGAIIDETHRTEKPRDGWFCIVRAKQGVMREGYDF